MQFNCCHGLRDTIPSTRKIVKWPQNEVTRVPWRFKLEALAQVDEAVGEWKAQAGQINTKWPDLV